MLVHETPDSEIVTAALAVRVGSRSETAAWSGLAHLAEHIACGRPTAAAGRLSAAGGVCNAVTQPDVTMYHGHVVADEGAALLDRLVEILEPPAAGPDRIAAEVTIVADEISAALDSSVMGGFPWLWLPSALYDTPELAHNGYGDLDSLGRVGEAELAAFFRRHYHAGNAALAICAPDPAPLLARLGATAAPDAPPAAPGGPAPVVTAAAPMVLTAPRQPHQATALAWSLPDQPLTTGHVAATVLADLLVGEHGGVLDERLDTLELSAYVGPFGDPWGIGAPLPFVVEIHHSAEIDPLSWSGPIREALRLLAAEAGEAEVAAVARILTVRYLAAWDDPAERSRMIATGEQVYGDAARVLTVPDLLAAADVTDVRAAAAALAEAPARILTRGPRP